MGKNYAEEEMIQILKKEIETSSITEEKIQDAYEKIRMEASDTEKSYVYSRKGRRWFMPVAAACVLLVSTVTVMAAMNGFFTKSVEKAEDKVAYKFEVNYELAPYRVTVSPGYIPEGYKETSEQKYCKDGSEQNGISLCVATADYLGQYGNSLDVSKVKSMEETKIQGMDANLITLDYDKERVTRTFDKRIYLFNEAEGYVGIVYGGNDLDMKTLVKVAENLTFVKTDEKVQPVSQKEIEKQKKDDAKVQEEEMDRMQKKWDAGVDKNQIQKLGTPFIWGPDADGFEITVLDTSVEDSISDFSADKFWEYKNIAAMLNEDGTLKPYKRITFKHSGKSFYPLEEDEEVSRDTAKQKFVKVKLRVKNLKKTEEEFWAGAPKLQNLKKGKDGHYAYAETYSEPLNMQEYGIVERDSAQYFDQSSYKITDGSYFYRKMKPGETLEYTLGFLVDADKTDSLYMNFGGRISTDPELEKDYEKYVEVQ